jgi:hypothetical protein
MTRRQSRYRNLTDVVAGAKEPMSAVFAGSRIDGLIRNSDETIPGVTGGVLRGGASPGDENCLPEWFTWKGSKRSDKEDCRHMGPRRLRHRDHFGEVIARHLTNEQYEEFQ